MKFRRITVKIHTLLSVLAIIFIQPLYAATILNNEWGLCRHELLSISANDELNSDEQGSTVLTADEGQAITEDLFKMEGGVKMQREGDNLEADSALYHKGEELVVAEGNVRFKNGGITIQGDSASLKLGENTGTIKNTKFQLHNRHVRGSAATAVIAGPDMTILKKVQYTTCNPGDYDWLLRSSTVKLNQKTGIGSATNVLLSFKHIPFLYLPYINFPIDDERKTGMLPPSYESSQDSGDEFSIPIYINIAPRFDATITPHIIEKRGTLFEGEFRYLNQHSAGKIKLEHIDHDKLFNDDRGAFYLQHNGSHGSHTTSEVELNYVADKDYLDEFGKNLSTSSITHIERRADLKYFGDQWTSSARLLGYQTVDDTIPDSARPYQVLPQLRLNSNMSETKNSLNYGLDSEYIFFEREDRVTGSRLYLQPNIDYPASSIATFFTPSIKIHHTFYKLQDQAPGTDEEITRTVPIFSLDSGIFLERNTHWGSKKFLHTLEPRLFYLYAPIRDQDTIPVFDSGAPDFNMAQLFRENRFSSVDRIGDANQISFALTTRLLEQETGKQRIKASIGQIVYFEDREVTLPGAAIDMTDRSDIISEATVQISDHLSANADVQWDTEINKTDKGSIQFRYKSDKHHIFNIGYRYRRDTLEQGDVSLLWSLGRNWNLIGRYNYSILDNSDLESLSGLEYQSCCWKMQVVLRRYLRDVPDDYDNTLFVQLELKGLASFGRDISHMLEQGILGYGD